MKLSYYGYSIERHSDQRHFLMDLRQFFSAFCRYRNPNYKNQFTYADEHVYLLNRFRNVYLFLITRDNDIIKKIREDDLTVTEISNLLAAGERIAFASYTYIDKHFFGFASTIMAPRVKAFTGFVNDVFRTLNIDQYKFVCHPLFAESTRAEIISLPFTGRSVIQVTKGHSLFEGIRELFSGSAEEFEDVESIEVVIKPRRRRNIKRVTNRVLQHLPDDGLEKFMVRAKEELQGHLIDYYLAGQGILSDPIDTKDERRIPAIILDKVANNHRLTEKIREHESDTKFVATEIPDIARYRDVRAWDNHIRNL